MEGVKVAITVGVVAPTPRNLMGSEVVRVCDTETVVVGRQSDVVVSGFATSKHVDDCTSSFLPNRGGSAASGPTSRTNKHDTELHRNHYLLTRRTTEEATQGLDQGLISGPDGKQIQRKVGKVPRNGSGSFRKLRLVHTENLSSPAGNDDSKMEVDMFGSHLVRCSNADKSQAGKQKNTINCRRGDKRHYKVPLRAKFDPFPMLAGLSSCSPAAGGSNTFGMYGLKPDLHDVTKHMDDISLNELLDGTYKGPTTRHNSGKKPANSNANFLNTVRKVCSLFRLQGIQQERQTEEGDNYGHQKPPSPSSPSNVVQNGCDGTNAPSSSNKELEAEVPVVVSDSSAYSPKDVLERLALPPPKDLESLWLETVKSPASMKPTDSRSSKQLSNGVSLPPFSWSHNFNGHHKSSNDALKVTNRSSCLGRWIRIRSSANFIGGGAEGFVDLDSLTYDESLVPAGQLRYQLPESGKTSTMCVSQHDKSSASGPAAPLPAHALHSPRVLAAARVLCDMASHSSKYNSGGILKWPKQPSQKSMKARKPRLNEIPEEEFWTPKSETVIDHVVKNVEYGSSSKRPRISLAERREEVSHVQAVIGLSSVSAPRSNRTSPSRLSRDSVSESRPLNGSYVKLPYLVPPPARALERSSHNPQKLRKVTPLDWNRSRS